MVLSMKAAARALRNSDFVKPDVKRELLKEIINGWKQLTKVLLPLVPLLAERGHASFDGMGFLLVGNFGENFEARLRSILMQIPNNVVSWYKEDLFSQKMGPLLLEYFENEEDEIKKHELLLLLIAQKPFGWKSLVEKYIKSKEKNSFYLHDVLSMLHFQYKYSYVDSKVLKDIKFLIKMSIAKHSGSKKVSDKAVNKIPDSMLPERSIP